MTPEKIEEFEIDSLSGHQPREDEEDCGATHTDVERIVEKLNEVIRAINGTLT